MGNCLSSGREHKGRRLDTWTRTGMVTLRDEGLHCVPPEVTRAATSAKIVDLSHNRIVALPEPMLQHMPYVQRLSLSSNAIDALPAGISGCTALKQLMLDNNALVLLPAEICLLQQMEVLAVQGNTLVALPADLGHLRNLKVLLCSNNRLQELPESLGSCSALEEVDAHSNAISSIPASFSKLQKLKLLQLDNNQVCSVPADILTGCRALQLLSLHGNPITADVLAATPGFEAYEARRKAKYDKAITGNVLLGSRGMDEGVDRVLA